MPNTHLVKRITEKVKESLSVLETPQSSYARRVNAISERIISDTRVDELIKILRNLKTKKFQELSITKTLPILGIFILGQHFLICNMGKEINTLKLLILVELFMNRT